MKGHNENIKSLIDKIKTLEALTGDRNLKDHKKIEELINKYLSDNIKSYHTRIMTPVEKQVLTPEAFNYLLELVRDDLLSFNEFEKVITQLTQYSHEFPEPLDEYAMISLLEMMSYTDFQESLINQIIQMYLSSPDIIHNMKFTVN